MLREHRLRWQVRRCWDGSPFYRARLEAAGLDPATFGGVADLGRIPILHASDLPIGDAAGAPSPEWTVAPEIWWQDTDRDGSHSPALARVLTDGDVTHRADLAARALWAAGARPNGAVTIRDEPDASVVAGLRRIGARAEVDGTTFHRAFALPPYVTSIVAHTCEADAGFHLADDHVLVEVVDPTSGTPVEVGASGALVITDLVREGSPLLRAWTGLETALTDALCRCGRTSQRAGFVRPLT